MYLVPCEDVVAAGSKRNVVTAREPEIQAPILPISEVASVHILTKTHRVYMDGFGPVNYYQNDIYWERADSWFFNSGDVHARHFTNWQDWCLYFGLPRSN